MNIVVVGAGKIGLAIIESLINEDHDITVIDSSEEAINDIKNNFDIMTIIGNCTDVNVLKEAGTQTANLFISVTGSDETNILSCYFAKKLNATYTMARIRNASNNESLAFITENAQIDFSLNPENLVANEIYNCLSLPNAAKAQLFSSKKLEMIELRLKENSVFDNKALKDIHTITKACFVICAVMRNNDIYIPDGNFVLKSGDRIGITATGENFKMLFRDMNLSLAKKNGSVMIFGGSRTAYYLAKLLSKYKRPAVIFEKDHRVCEELAEELNDYCTIAEADGSRKDILQEYGIYDAPAFVGLTGMDEENILISYFAMNCDVPTVISKVNSYDMMKMAEKIGLDNVINPKVIVSDLVIQYARGLQNTLDTKVETVYSLFDFNVEALEFIVGPGYKYPGVKLTDLPKKSDILVAGIVRNNETIIPTGSDTIEVGDRVVMITKLKHIDNINSIFD